MTDILAAIDGTLADWPLVRLFGTQLPPREPVAFSTCVLPQHFLPVELPPSAARFSGVLNYLREEW